MKYSEKPRGAQTSEYFGNIKDMDLDYNYPGKLDWHPRSELHGYMLNKILDLCEHSKGVTDGVKDEWKKLDWSLNAYVPLDEYEAAIKNADWRKSVNIVIPMTFASLETFLTYFQSAFIQDPIHRYKGHGENRVGAMLMERIVARQGQWFKEPLKLDTMWRDGLTYGIGAAHVSWAKHRVRHTITTEVDELLHEALRGTPFKSQIGDIIRHMEEAVAYEGNKLSSIDPYKIFLDPRVSPNDYQDAAFIGWVDDADLFSLMQREMNEDDGIFNMKAVAAMASANCAYSRYYCDESGRSTRQQNEGTSVDFGLYDSSSPPVHLIHMYMKLIPKHCNLGDSEYPEVWEFTVAGDSVIIQANRLDLDHGMYPIVLCAPNTDGHSVLPVSYLATTYGLQQTIDQMIRLNIEEMRTSINNKLIYDPSRIEEEDLLDSRNGGLIRIKRSAYNGESIDTYCKQLAVGSVTQGNIGNAGIMIDLLRQANGTTDITMGNLSAMPERPTATGIDAAKSGALSRLQRIAQTIGRQCMDDLAWQYAYNTIQFMSQPAYVEMGMGRHESMLRTAYGYAPGEMGEVEVSPFDLKPYFDIEPSDGSLPNNENAQAWTTIMQTMLGVEGAGQELAQRSDIFKMFTHWARVMGARDIHEFVREGGGQFNPQVMSDAPGGQLEQQVQAGNMVPMQGMGV